MRYVIAACCALAAGPAGSAAESGNGGTDDEWRTFGRVIALVQSVVHVAARSADPHAMERGVERLLSGADPEANRLAGELLDDAFEDMPAKYRGNVMALARDLATIAARERAGRPHAPDATRADAALQARKDLAAIGLRYYDAAQFLDAVRRGDRLAVELFVVARGVDLGARDAEQMSALDIARKRNDRHLSDLLESARRR